MTIPSNNKTLIQALEYKLKVERQWVRDVRELQGLRNYHDPYSSCGNLVLLCGELKLNSVILLPFLSHINTARGRKATLAKHVPAMKQLEL